jgi:GTP cyclohydrolase-4
MNKKKDNTTVDTQDEPPQYPIHLEKAGICNLKTSIKINRSNTEYRHIPVINIFMNLDKMRKGVHMSRFIESITETVEEEVAEEHYSLEHIGKHILQTLKDKHHFEKAGVHIDSELPVYQKTPASKKNTVEVHTVSVTVVNKGETWKKYLMVSVVGNTVCPHALSMNHEKTHIQRAIGELTIETDFENDIALEDMIDTVEQSFSAKVYTLLKSEDESAIVDAMFQNPLFVEDVCRNMLKKASNRFKNCYIHAKCISNESIHRHDVYAEGSVHT